MRSAWMAAALAVGVAHAGPAMGPQEDPWRGHDHVPGEVVLDFEDHLSNARVLDTVRQLGLRDGEFRSEESDDDNLVVARVPVGQSPASMAARAEGADGLEGASPNWILRATYLPNDPRFGEQWHMSQIHAPEAWDVSAGQGAVVAVLDTGVTFEKDARNGDIKLLEDLEGTRWVGGYDFVNDRTVRSTTTPTATTWPGPSPRPRTTERVSPASPTGPRSCP